MRFSSQDQEEIIFVSLAKIRLMILNCHGQAGGISSSLQYTRINKNQSLKAIGDMNADSQVKSKNKLLSSLFD